MRQNRDFSFDAFEREYIKQKKTDASISGYFEDKASDLDSLNKYQTATLYRATLNSLLDYDDKISFAKITPKYLKAYERHMLKKGHTYTTVGIYLRNLKHISPVASFTLIPGFKIIRIETFHFKDNVISKFQLFNFINHLHEKASLIVTTNKSPQEWVKMLDDEVIATALLDRILFHCEVVRLTGTSYRLENRKTIFN